MCWSSRSQENINAEFFNDLVRQRPTILLKRDSTIGEKLQNFEEHLFYRTVVADCFWIYQNINYQKPSVSANY